MAVEAAKVGGTLPAVMNYINEWAVGKYLEGKLRFYDISDIMYKSFGIYSVKEVASLDDVLDAESWAAEYVAMF